jgi:hypothetical protein
MRNAKDITYGELSKGDKFEWTTPCYDPYPTLVDKTFVVEVIEVRVTKKGRVNFKYTTNHSNGKVLDWTHTACAPTTLITD